MVRTIKRILILLTFFVGFSFWGNSAVFASNTPTAVGGWNAYVHLPDDYTTTGSQTYPAIIYIPGQNQVGTDTSLILKTGPNAYIEQGGGGSVLVNGATQKFIVISLQPSSAYPRPNILKGKSDGFVVKTSIPTASANINGTTTSTVFPSNATADSFYLTPNAPGGSVSDTAAQLIVNGLNTSSTYTVTIYASRMAGDTTNRTARYTIGSQSTTLNATDNTNNTVQLTNITPINGSITFNMSLVGSYGYMSILKVVEN